MVKTTGEYPWRSAMPYDEGIASKIEEVTSGWKEAERKKMFGGICYLLRGNMACGVYREYLIVRLGEDRSAKALGEPHVRPFDITGKPMKGWVMVEKAGTDGDSLRRWLDAAREFTEALPPKKKK